MNTFTIVLLALRNQVRALRLVYRNNVYPPKTPRRGRDILRQQLCRDSQARLSYLVPLYNALNAVAQHLGTRNLRGIQSYTKRFAEIEALMRKHVNSSDYGRYFGEELDELLVLVPKDGVPPTQWTCVTLKTLTDQVEEAIEAARQAQLKKQRLVSKLERAFLDSLSDEQRKLLVDAIDGGAGRISMVISRRDVVTK